jgi:hypothetical protein
VRNIGLDHSGTHCGTAEHLAVTLADRPVDVRAADVTDSPIGRQAFELFLRGERQPPHGRRGIWRAWRNWVRSAFRP